MGLLGEFVKIKTGKLDANAAIEGGKYPFFTCSKTNLAIDDYAFNADAVLVAGNGDLNVKHYKGKFNAYQRTYVITVENTEILDSRYLYHWMSKYVDRLRELSIGGVIKYIKLGMLTDAEFPLPPLEEQKRIAAILDKADAIRRKRQQAIDLTDQLLRSVFLDMFGNPVSNPKGWPVESLGIHLSFVTSGSRGWAKYYSEDGALFIRSLDVHMNELVFGEAAFVSPPENAEAKRTMVYKGDVLLTITGSRIGRVAPVRDDLGQAHISQHVAIIRLNETLNAEFLSMFLSDINGGQKQIKESSYGQTKPGLNLDQIKNFQVPIPPIELQEQYLQAAQRIRKFNYRLNKTIEGTNNLFKSLNIRAFRGELSKQIKAA